MYRDFLDCLITEGVRETAERLGCFWSVTDIISVAMTKFKGKEGFLNCVVIQKDNQATLKIDDGNGNPLYHQKYEWTDLKENLNFWAVENELNTYTVLLPQEY